MKVKLINDPTLKYVDWAIGECYNKGCYLDKEKQQKRIERVALNNKHSSVLEFVDYIFEIEASTKVLLEMTRHRHASYACKSSRYTLNKGEIVFESSGNEVVDHYLNNLKNTIEKLMAKKISNDILSLLLPQAYQYKWVAKFNGRSLLNFLQLRTAKSAHYHIREVAQEMYEALPESHKFLFEECVYVD